MARATNPAVWPALKRLLAAIGIWAALGASSAGGDTRAGEWRSWCPGTGPGQAPISGPSLGWHFYCDREEERQEAEPPPAQPPSEWPAAGDSQSATDRILVLRRALEEARAEAILDPTPAKVAAYLRLQQATLQRAAVFSDAFRRTVWATPELDYTLKRPVGALAKQVWSDERREARDRALASLKDRYGLIYLGHAGCAGCKVFGPLLRAFATRHGLDVLAVSLTGAALEGWPEAVADNGRAARLGLGDAPVPALVLFDTSHKARRSRSASASWPRTRWPNASSRSPPWSPDMTIERYRRPAACLALMLLPGRDRSPRRPTFSPR